MTESLCISAGEALSVVSLSLSEVALSLNGNIFLSQDFSSIHSSNFLSSKLQFC